MFLHAIMVVHKQVAFMIQVPPKTKNKYITYFFEYIFIMQFLLFIRIS